mmetsp:Transcript_36911/g.82076  ORF Transcript_36911/g.82076 Transcript_36911/m.82076 type:complete len:270 (+) Transcript_36911:159-968(+)|eukprot:CAMPEP_0202891264 /NCGR_PEP_ID=MMETSP1392-20130828/1371_1 /ASSEMBLY_ACC=CAM_ASM_000868 /TAXON_ID=225041 /ORGANISM="Chlamydomonas chlamydogama, Strain SAG 11-48b" /LENGTH=269 /DNA_ID=CAMNT_0049574967 /DNA_START=144 /DNA_END=953 /DNA_ORIENTATION=+
MEEELYHKGKLGGSYGGSSRGGDEPVRRSSRARKPVKMDDYVEGDDDELEAAEEAYQPPPPRQPLATSGYSYGGASSGEPTAKRPRGRPRKNPLPAPTPTTQQTAAGTGSVLPVPAPLGVGLGGFVPMSAVPQPQAAQAGSGVHGFVPSSAVPHVGAPVMSAPGYGGAAAPAAGMNTAAISAYLAAIQANQAALANPQWLAAAALHQQRPPSVQQPTLPAAMTTPTMPAYASAASHANMTAASMMTAASTAPASAVTAAPAGRDDARRW